MAMNVLYISSLCRRRALVRLQGRHRFQWHTRASSTSLSNVQKNQSDITDLVAPIKKPSRHFQRQPDAGDLLESIFESIASTDTAKDDGLPPTKTYPNQAQEEPPIEHGVSTETYQHMAMAESMLRDKQVPMVDVWDYFVDHFAQNPRHGQQVARPNGFPLLARTLFTDIRHAIKEERELHTRKTHKTLPSMTKVVKIYTKQGLMSHKDWPQVIWEVLSGLISQEGRPDIDHLTVKLQQIDLLGVWELFCRQYHSGDHDISDQAWGLPISLSRTDIFRQNLGTADLYSVSQTLFPAFPSKEQFQPLAYAAILTYGLLFHPSRVQHPLVKRGEQFLRTISRAIGRDWTTRADVKDGISQSLGITDAKIRDALWGTLVETAHQSQPDVPDPFTEWAYHDLVQLVNRAVNSREFERIDALYASAKNGEHDFQNDVRFYNKFIKAYMECKHPGRAIEVWNHMIKIGLNPTIQSWNAMLNGCRTNHDVQALEGLWVKLQKSGVKPDVECWTTVICGFIESKGAAFNKSGVANADRGVRLLQEMGRIWLEAERRAASSGSENTAVKPTIYTVNAAMASLFSRQFWDTAYKLIPWAKQFGLKQDVVTCNTILRHLIRSGQPEKAQKLLQDMHDTGIVADHSTFVIILEETFRHSSQYTQEQRAALIENVFEEMETSGLKPNLFIYGKIIYILLGDAKVTGDVKAVQSVLEKMKNQNLEPGEHILTCLVDYYFRSNPPEFDLIEQTIHEMRYSRQVKGEIIFWDRVIEGYSRLGDWTRALKHFGAQDRQGKRVGWNALLCLLQALVNTGQTQLAEQLIRDVGNTRRAPPAAKHRGFKAEHAFWEMVKIFMSDQVIAIRPGDLRHVEKEVLKGEDGYGEDFRHDEGFRNGE